MGEELWSTIEVYVPGMNVCLSLQSRLKACVFQSPECDCHLLLRSQDLCRDSSWIWVQIPDRIPAGLIGSALISSVEPHRLLHLVMQQTEVLSVCLSSHLYSWPWFWCQCYWSLYRYLEQGQAKNYTPKLWCWPNKIVQLKHEWIHLLFFVNFTGFRCTKPSNQKTEKNYIVICFSVTNQTPIHTEIRDSATNIMNNIMDTDTRGIAHESIYWEWIKVQNRPGWALIVNGADKMEHLKLE